jgi:E3 ubiquitin-protein ligase MARCH6
MLDGLDDMDGVEDVRFDELIGMQGVVFHLVQNAITVRISSLSYFS